VDKIAIFGAGGFGLEVAMLIEQINEVTSRWHIVGFFDDDPALSGKTINGYPVLGGIEALEGLHDIALSVAIEDPSKRIRAIQRLERKSIDYPNLIHPAVLIGNDVILGFGNILCAGVIVTVNNKIGNFCHFNFKTCVGPDCIIEDFTTTGLSVDFSGNNQIGNGTFFGDHSAVLKNVSVGARSRIGAGVLIEKDIPISAGVEGVPARMVRQGPVFIEMEKQEDATTKKELNFESKQNLDDGRFQNWEYPEIKEGELTRYNWMVQHVENIKLGYKTDIGAFTYINAKNGVIIEDYVQIGSHCSIYSVSTIDSQEGLVRLKKNCKVGSHSIVMPGVTIGENSIIGSLSFVNRDIPPNVIAAGCPVTIRKNSLE